VFSVSTLKGTGRHPERWRFFPSFTKAFRCFHTLLPGGFPPVEVIPGSDRLRPYRSLVGGHRCLPVAGFIRKGPPSWFPKSRRGPGRGPSVVLPRMFSFINLSSAHFFIAETGSRSPPPCIDHAGRVQHPAIEAVFLPGDPPPVNPGGGRIYRFPSIIPLVVVF